MVWSPRAPSAEGGARIRPAKPSRPGGSSSDELIARGAAAGERVICLSNGDRVRADPAGDRVMARAFLLKGAYERGFTAWVETVVKPGDVAIDVGVAYGVVSLALARRGARVFSVEANPVMAKAAAENVALNGASGVTIVNKAASDRPGEVTFASVGVHYVGSSKIIPDASAGEKLKFLDEMNGLSSIDLGARRRPAHPWRSRDRDRRGHHARPHSARSTACATSPSSRSTSRAPS